jgi:FtsP/CotA-like multicopper oxidase with cupredoxin domain
METRQQGFSRRGVVGLISALGVGLFGLAACGTAEQQTQTAAVAGASGAPTLSAQQNAGVWACHCHVLSHAESEQGMFGVVTAQIVKE